MTSVQQPDEAWPRGWEEHERFQQKRLAELPFAEKLQWLEDAQELVEAILAARIKQGLDVPATDDKGP